MLTTNIGLYKRLFELNQSKQIAQNYYISETKPPQSRRVLVTNENLQKIGAVLIKI